MKKINRYFDHTLLKPDATTDDISKLCREAVENNFYSVCVNSCRVRLACEELLKLHNNNVKVASVVGFPLGAMTCEAKCQETVSACDEGADEIDMVINIGALKDGDYDAIIDEIVCVVGVATEYDAIVKVIIETCLLTDDEIVKACELSMKAGAAFVKTSTGFSTGGATVHAVELMRKTVGDDMQIKASGGIRTLAMARKMIDAGADRIGASASVDIMKELADESE